MTIDMQNTKQIKEKGMQFNATKQKLLILLLLPVILWGQITQYSAVRDFGTPVSSQALDLTISLYRPWDELTPELREEYEEIIAYLGDAIYESTNGGHYLGTVRFFTDGKYANIADINWIDDKHPQALPGSFLRLGGQIYVGDDFSYKETTPEGVEETYYCWRFPGLSETSKRHFGYTLAHEIGHYVYDLRDEYSLRGGDVPVEPSIMNYQYHGADNKYQWLNFSTSNNIGDLTKTGQGRTWGMDAWTFLQDERTSNYYPVLGLYAPTSTDSWTDPTGTNTDWVRVELPTTDSRDHLEIIWMAPKMNIDFTLDVSGSMSGTKLADLKSTTKALLDIIQEQTSDLDVTANIGLTSFSGTVTDVLPLTEMTETNITTFKDLVDNLTAGGVTAMYDACLTSLSKLNGAADNETKMSFLLSDGLTNSGAVRSASNVITAYQNKQVPVYTFAYGDNHADENLRLLANETGGSYASNVSADELLTMWMDIVDRTLDLQFAQKMDFTKDSGFPFTVDQTVKTSIMQVKYTAESAGSSASFTVNDNNGMPVPATTTIIALSDAYPRTEIALVKIDSAAVANAATGEWSVNSSSTGTVSQDMNVTVKVAAKKEGTYSLALELSNGQNQPMEKPVTIYAALSKGAKNIANATVAGTITSPSGTVNPVQFSDDGEKEDLVANDGIYTATYTGFYQVGAHKVHVSASNDYQAAYMATAGISYAINPDGSQYTPLYESVVEKFVRKEVASFAVYAGPQSVTDSILGFESAALWSFQNGSGTLTSSPTCTQGSAALSVGGNGWQTIKSAPINTALIDLQSDAISFDLFVGDRQSSPWWTGSVQLSIHCPSANIYQEWVGSEQLNNLPLDQYSTVTFDLNPRQLQMLAGQHSDLQFFISLSSNPNSGDYYLDNIRFTD